MQEEPGSEDTRGNHGGNPYSQGGQNDRNQNANRDDSFLDTKHKDKKGTIIIEFYKTEQFERKSRPYQVHTKQYEQHFLEDANKKSFADTVRIKEGKEFSLPSKNP